MENQNLARLFTLTYHNELY